MIKQFIAIILVTFTLGLSINQAQAFYYDGKFLTLQTCRYGSFHGDFGYIGMYTDSMGNGYQIFFGDDYCEY